MSARLLVFALCAVPNLWAWQSTDGARLWKEGTDRFYTFDFAGSVRDFRDAENASTTADQKLEYQYWLSKALWISLLDAQTNVNDDFMTAALDRIPIDPKRVDRNIQSDYEVVTRAGIKICEDALRKSPGNLDALYYLAAFRSNDAAYTLIIGQRQFAALSAIKACMRMFNQVLARDPSKIQMLALLGLTHYMVGSNPWYVRMLGPIFGLEGTKSQGIEELERASRAGSIDAKFMLKAILVREGRLREGLALLQELSIAYPKNVAFRRQQEVIRSRLGGRN